MVSLNSPRLPLSAVVVALALLAGIAPRAGAGRGAAYEATTSIEELLARARQAVAEVDYGVAEDYYEEILRRERTNLPVILELSTVYERTGRLEYARGLLIRAARIDPRYPALEERRRAIDHKLVAGLVIEEDSLIALGSWDDAIPKLSLHNAIDPGNPSVHYKRAMCLFETGRYEAALSDIDVAIAASPQEPYFLLRDRINREFKSGEIKQLESKARSLARSKEPRHRDQTLDLLSQILQLDPEHAWARSEFIRLTESEAAPAEPVDETPSPVRNALVALWDAIQSLGRFGARHATPLAILAIVIVVFRSRLTAALVRRLARPRQLSGDLARFTVAEILTMLNAEPRAGVLEIQSKACRGHIYFEGGEPTHCVAGKEQGVDALMSLIARADTGRFTFTEGPASLDHTIDTPLSILLVERAHRANGVNMRPGVAAARKSRMKELLDSKIEV